MRTYATALTTAVVVVVVLTSAVAGTLALSKIVRRRQESLRRAVIAARAHAQSTDEAVQPTANGNHISGTNAQAVNLLGAASSHRHNGPPEAELYTSPYAMQLEETLRTDPASFVVPMGNVIIKEKLVESSSSSSPTSVTHPAGIPTEGQDDDDALARIGSDYTLVSIAGDDELSQDYTATEVASVPRPRGGNENADTPLSLTVSRQLSSTAFVPSRENSGLAHLGGSASTSLYQAPVPPHTAAAAATASAGIPGMVAVPPSALHEELSDTAAETRTAASLRVAAATATAEAQEEHVPVHRTHHRHHIDKGGYVVVLREVENPERGGGTAEGEGRAQTTPSTSAAHRQHGEHLAVAATSQEQNSSRSPNTAAASVTRTEQIFLQRCSSSLVYGRGTYMEPSSTDNNGV